MPIPNTKIIVDNMILCFIHQITFIISTIIFVLKTYLHQCAGEKKYTEQSQCGRNDYGEGGRVKVIYICEIEEMILTATMKRVISKYKAVE